MTKHAAFIEATMKDFYNVLPEDLKRVFAAISSDQLGHGGGLYIRKLFSCSPSTIKRGKDDIDAGYLKKNSGTKRQRKEGGGRKKRI